MSVFAMLAAGAVGAWLRYEISGWIQSRTESAFPLGTSAVNVLGTILFAVLVALHQKEEVSSELLFVFGVGFAGAFTTFSTWMVETGRLMKGGGRKRFGVATVNVALQLVVALLLAALILAVL